MLVAILDLSPETLFFAPVFPRGFWGIGKPYFEGAVDVSDHHRDSGSAQHTQTCLKAELIQRIVPVRNVYYYYYSGWYVSWIVSSTDATHGTRL